MRRLNKLHMGLAISILLFLGLGYLMIKPNLDDKLPYLSFSADRDGVKAWRELLESKQSRVREWRLDWKDLPTGTKQALVAVQPDAVSKDDVEDMLRWVKQGNDLIILDQQPFEWNSYFPIEINKAETDLSSKHQAEEDPISSAEQVRAITRQGDAKDVFTGSVQTLFRLTPTAKQQALFSDKLGVLASRIAMGPGSFTMAVTPEWLENGSILSYSHFELIWPLFAESYSTVWIDETHHGYGTTRGLPSVYPAWLKLAALQLGLALLCWLWLRGKRFGPVYTPRAWTVRRGDETLLAVAGWYERLGFSREALAHQQLHLRQLLLERWGLSPSASAQQAAEAARARWPEAQAVRLARLLEAMPLPSEAGKGSAAGANARPREGLSAKAFVERTREMGEMIAYLEKE